MSHFFGYLQALVINFEFIHQIRNLKFEFDHQIRLLFSRRTLLPSQSSRGCPPLHNRLRSLSSFVTGRSTFSSLRLPKQLSEETSPSLVRFNEAKRRCERWPLQVQARNARKKSRSVRQQQKKFDPWAASQLFASVEFCLLRRAVPAFVFNLLRQQRSTNEPTSSNEWNLSVGSAELSTDSGKSIICKCLLSE